MNKIIRFLAVIALALSPVWGVQTVEAASGLAPVHHSADWPVYPSFISNSCNAIVGPSNGPNLACAVGGFVTTQVFSGYSCNELDMNVSSFGSGPFIVVATANNISSTFTINDTGNYYTQFPFPLVLNEIVIQISAPQSGVMTIGFIQTTPCPVATFTPTVNPSSTATNTPVPVTGTPTPIPTFTPLPSGHSTFTPTVTRTGTVTPVAPTGTRTATATPIPERDCGSYVFPLLNCDWLGFTGQGGPMPYHWTNASNTAPVNSLPYCGYTLIDSVNPPDGQMLCFGSSFQNGTASVYQVVTAGATGTVWISIKSDTTSSNLTFWFHNVNSGLDHYYVASGVCPISGGTTCDIQTGGVTAGDTVDLGMNSTCSCNFHVYLVTTFMPGVATATPSSTPANTGTPTVTPTGLPGTATATGTPTLTPVPIPGAMSTNIPTATECPGSCVVTQLTAIPGMSTRVTVDTSPFSPFTSLSLARSTCQPFGYVAIPYPVVHGTPAYGSTTPLSITWTTPITAPWDDTHPFSNTALQPCAMLKEIPTLVWDFTYWFSVFSIAVVFIMWLIGFVGRLSGEETING